MAWIPGVSPSIAAITARLAGLAIVRLNYRLICQGVLMLPLILRYI